MSWRTVLPELLAQGAYETQGEICRALGDRGWRVDQAAVSRELKRAGAQKVDGAYRVPVGGRSAFQVDQLHATAGDCLVVIRTAPAYAMVLARAIDAESLPGVLGTVAGDDTVLVATSGPSALHTLRHWLGLPPPAAG